MGLSVFGLQQTAARGWSNPAVIASIRAGLVLLAAFVVLRLRTRRPLIDVRIFGDPVPGGGGDGAQRRRRYGPRRRLAITTRWIWFVPS